MRGSQISTTIDKQSIVVIDCQVAGISGDMLLAALIDIGLDFPKLREKVIQIIKLVPTVKNCKIEAKKIVSKGVSATRLEIDFQDEREHRTGNELVSILNLIIKELNWRETEKELALSILKTLIKAEATIHGISEEQVHLHEAGSIDTIIDIAGFILACKELGLLENCIWVTTPVAVGGGILNFSHGKTSIPAPAVLEILKNKKIEILGGPIESELTTPTGAAILVNLVKESNQFYPQLFVEAVGYGAGSKDFATIPNVLRITKGELSEPIPYNLEELLTIETNVDDVTGEILENTITKLGEKGWVKDTAIIPMTSKKRPGYVLQILAGKEYLASIIDLLMKELGTLGVRFFQNRRYTLNRKIITIPIHLKNEIYPISVKVSWNGKNIIIQTKPESDEVLQLSKAIGMPMRELLIKIYRAIEELYPLGQHIDKIR
ncbi:MAG: nickel pincer cofactor biosynthesis protein LarC [Promethearchaeota archaeon]|nr:MAG: nickel pincer cofactor biosynthesis protein LarC [Candidatus Lokiarchaeota archaeon]